MNLNRILEEINKNKPFAEEDVDSGPIETLTARRGRRNQAVEQLKRLKREYRRELLNNAVFIIVTGSDRDAFVSTAVENGKFLSIDPEEFYRDLAGRVSPQIYAGKMLNASVFQTLSHHLEDKALELDLISYPQIIFKSEYNTITNNQEDLINVVKRAVNEQMGAEIVAMQATHSLTDAAIDKNQGGKLVPILMPATDEKLAKDMLTAFNNAKISAFLVVAGKGAKDLRNLEGVVVTKTVNTENVENALNTIKNNVKK